MSITNVSYDGYGIDLGRMRPDLNYNDELLLDVIEEDEHIENFLQGDVLIQTPVNTDSFELLLWFAPVPIVADKIESLPKVKQYTTEQANEKLVQIISNLFEHFAKKEHLHAFTWSKAKLDKWVNENAEYPYDKWNDCY